MPISPTQRTLAHLRNEGYTAAVVEHWNPHARIRQDLFGIIDILALRGSETIAIQCTTAPHMAERVQKIADSEHIAAIREAGWTVQVWGWKLPAKSRTWVHRVVDCS